MLYRQNFFALEPSVCKSLKVWTGLKMRLRSYKLAVTNFGIILSPHSICEMKHIIRQSWSGCTWKKTSPNLLFLVVADWR